MPISQHELSDRAEINDVMVAYGVALDHPGRRWDLWFRCFTDAIINYPILGQMTPQVAYETFDKATSQSIASQHLFLNILIDLHGDRADVRSECLWVSHKKTDDARVNTLQRSGLWYQDKFVRTADGWRIAQRDAHLKWSDWAEQPA